MNDNKLKAINGSRSKSELVSRLKELCDKRSINFCLTDYRCGYREKNSEQFYAPFYIEFFNGNGWLIFSTNSIRNDRMCIQQWNAEHIKRIKPNVKKAIMVVPDEVRDNEREKREVEKYREKISSDYYSAIDDVIYQEQLARYIEHYM